MEIIQKSAWVNCPVNQLFNLVADIESYPKFLPWCSGAQILNHSSDVVEASLTLSKGGLSKKFATRNTLYPHRQIDISLLSGPFKHLEGVWHFSEEGQGARVALQLEFSFENRLIAMMIGPIFQPVANTLLEAFITRAQQTCPNQNLLK